MPTSPSHSPGLLGLALTLALGLLAIALGLLG